jgi:hypothetical protein
LPRRLIYSRQALTDLDVVYRWQFGCRRHSPHQGHSQCHQDAEAAHPCRYPAGEHPGVRELPCDGGCRVLYRVVPDTGRDETGGDVQVLRVFGPGQSRDRL